MTTVFHLGISIAICMLFGIVIVSRLAVNSLNSGDKLLYDKTVGVFGARPGALSQCNVKRDIKIP